MENFIKSNEVTCLKFFGIIIRIDLVLIDKEYTIYIVTKRTCNKRNEETWTFTKITDALVKYKDLISNINTNWGSEIANLIHE